MQKLSYASGRRKRYRRVDIPEHEIKRMVEVEGWSVEQMALQKGVSRSTIQNRLREAYPRGRENGGKGSFLKHNKPIYLPKDKIAFVLKVDPDKAADVEILLKGLAQEFQVAGKAAYSVIDPRITRAHASGYIAELDRRNEFEPPQLKTPHYRSRIWPNALPGSPQPMMVH